MGLGQRDRGIRRFIADTLPHNRRMLNVFTAAGWKVERRFESGAVRVECAIEPTTASVARVEAREHSSEAASVARI